jgi:hypothetical protein
MKMSRLLKDELPVPGKGVDVTNTHSRNMYQPNSKLGQFKNLMFTPKVNNFSRLKKQQKIEINSDHNSISDRLLANVEDEVEEIRDSSELDKTFIAAHYEATEKLTPRDIREACELRTDDPEDGIVITE